MRHRPATIPQYLPEYNISRVHTEIPGDWMRSTGRPRWIIPRCHNNHVIKHTWGPMTMGWPREYYLIELSHLCLIRDIEIASLSFLSDHPFIKMASSKYLAWFEQMMRVTRPRPDNENWSDGEAMSSEKYNIVSSMKHELGGSRLNRFAVIGLASVS